MKKIKKPINNIYFYFMLISLFFSITFLVMGLSNASFKQIRNFWGFWLIWIIFISIFVIMLILFILNFFKYKNNQKLLNQKHFMCKKRKTNAKEA